MMESFQQTFNCDETPTPTRFIRDCEEVGLFQDLQNNPFEKTFKKALQTPRTPQSLPEPLSKTAKADTLDTPQVVPKHSEEYPHAYPIIDDDEDEIQLSSNYIIKYIPDEENKSFDESQVQISEKNGNQMDETLPKQTFMQIIKQQQDQNDNKRGFIDLTLSPISDQTRQSQTHIYSNELVEEVFLDNDQNLFDKSITDEFLILKNKKNPNQDVKILPKIESKPNIQLISHSSTVIANKNVLILPAQKCSQFNDVMKISPKPETPAKPIVLDRLKSLLRPNGETITKPNEITNLIAQQPKAFINDDRTKNRERNREAQKRSRIRKKRWEAQLKQDTRSVHDENKRLRSEIVSLRAEIANLKTLLLAHKTCPVTQAMYGADISDVVQMNQKRPVNSVILPKPEILNGSLNGETTPKVHIINSEHIPNKKLVIDSRKVPILQLNGSLNGLKRSQTEQIAGKPSLKVFIGNAAPKIQSINSPNAVKVIHFNQNTSEVTDLTYDTS